MQVWPATVKRVDGLTCTVNLLNTGLTGDAAVPGVKLRANDEMEEGVLVVPRLDSFVFVASVENSMDTLFVCYVSEVDRVEAIIKKTKVVMDEFGITAEREKIKVVMDGGNKEIKATNDKVTLTLNDYKLVADADGKATVTLDATGNFARLERGSTMVQLASKVTVKTAGTSLKLVLDELNDYVKQIATMLQTFQVLCTAPGSPSAPFPGSVVQATNIGLLLTANKQRIGQLLE